jgi:hypothetical protein
MLSALQAREITQLQILGNARATATRQRKSMERAVTVWVFPELRKAVQEFVRKIMEKHK